MLTKFSVQETSPTEKWNIPPAGEATDNSSKSTMLNPGGNSQETRKKEQTADADMMVLWRSPSGPSTDVPTSRLQAI